MDISLNYINRIHDSIGLYHQNIHEYNENMRRYIHIIEDIYSNRNVTTNTAAYPIRNENNSTMPIITRLIRNYLRNRDDVDILRNNYEDVVVRPSAAEIESATYTVVFDELHNNHNTTCPITLEPFRTGEEICSIRHCSHLFKRHALMNWFRSNVRCPVCRYDIRDYVEPIVNEENEVNEENPENEFDDLIDELVNEYNVSSIPSIPSVPSVSTRRLFSTPTSNINSLTNVIRSFVNTELNNLPQHLSNAAEILYTFDIPLSLDLSGNYRM